jgi:hypothetical protein
MEGAARASLPTALDDVLIAPMSRGLHRAVASCAGQEEVMALPFVGLGERVTAWALDFGCRLWLGRNPQRILTNSSSVAENLTSPDRWAGPSSLRKQDVRLAE